ncbi:unnamed protein product [Brassica napus]|uniref:(rape) hypothetical protein n=1 Tax=Brassica napus TaxID=3708 RepID=A0A816S0W9_BRANA|nr:unnamed protein product [Brassica napus]
MSDPNLKHPLGEDYTASQERLSKVARIDGFSDEEEEGGHESESPENPRVQRYLVAVEYVGTRFFGSQQQPKYRTVVGVLQEAFHKFIGQPVKIFCSSRTDAGVHALSNVCHVDVERVSKRKPGEVLPPHEPDVVQKAVNHFLQKNEGDVMVIDVRCVPSNYHARYKAKERTYFYRMLSGPDPLSIFEKDRAWHVPEELDLRAMQEACRVLVGSHDFSSFRASGCQAKSPVRSLDELSVTEVPSTPYFPPLTERTWSNPNNGDPLTCSSQPKTETAGVTTNGDTFGIRKRHRCYVITARSRGFLYHQVRLIVAVLKCVGTGELTVLDVERILKAKDVSASKPMAPASGLYRTPAPSFRALRFPFSSSLGVCYRTTVSPLSCSSNNVQPAPVITAWSEFAQNVSGEWDGFGADFSREGHPLELPESVVPEAYREWEVKVFDWQTQCPTLAQPHPHTFLYKSIKLLPTVGCEADAATRHSVDQRTIGPTALSFSYSVSGSYVAVWQPLGNNNQLLELEHCLVNPNDKESRVRIFQVVETTMLSLRSVKVFRELWYGPFRDGDQLGGCATRSSGFASTPATAASAVARSWRAVLATTSFDSGCIQQFTGEKVVEIVREEKDLLLLPQDLWCSLQEGKDGQRLFSVGWLFEPGHAITSTCVFSSDSKLEEVTMGRETALTDL